MIVPDEATWAMWGYDLAALGFVPANGVAPPAVLVAPVHVPAALAAATVLAWESMSEHRRVVSPGDPLVDAMRLDEILAQAGSDTTGEQPEMRGVAHSDHSEMDDPDPGEADHSHHAGMDHSHLAEMDHSDDRQAAHPDHSEMDRSDRGEAADSDHSRMDGMADMGGEDMMAIVGEPSADGLVMESLEFEVGPVSSLLPGGLLVSLALDGDVVVRCGLTAVLRMGAGAGVSVPDPLAGTTWVVAVACSEEGAAGGSAGGRVGLLRLAAVEVERAVSHLAWLRSFARILGWAELVAHADTPLGPLIGAHARLRQLVGERSPGTLEEGIDALLGQARRPLERLAGLLDASRRLASRTRGVAVVSAAQAERLGLRGPVARAAGLAVDVRADDELYAALGFVPVLERAGDAEARMRVRVAEALAARTLAETALRLGAVPSARPGLRVEGARGPVEVTVDADDRLALAAPGSAAALRLAGECAIGLEWSRALIAIASFDLSPWQVAG